MYDLDVEDKGSYNPEAPKFVYRKDIYARTRKTNYLPRTHSPEMGDRDEVKFGGRGRSDVYKKGKVLLGYKRIYKGKGAYTRVGRPKSRSGKSYFSGKTYRPKSQGFSRYVRSFGDKTIREE